jgi:alpha-amylase
MIRFRKAAAGTARANNWNDGQHAVAFSRPEVGFVIINNGTAPMTVTVPTGLAPGSYCDLLTGGEVANACVGTTHVVASDGRTEVTVSARSAVVLLEGDQP